MHKPGFSSVTDCHLSLTGVNTVKAKEQKSSTTMRYVDHLKFKWCIITTGNNMNGLLFISCMLLDFSLAAFLLNMLSTNLF